jgi:hypothetical protein
VIQAYSKRLLSPFTGQVQVVETEQARALTLDGSNWEVQFRFTFIGESPAHTRQSSNAEKHAYIRVAIIRQSGIERIPFPRHLDSGDVEQQVQRLAAYLKDVRVPLPPADVHEYWLLDEKEEMPLALIFSCVYAEEMPLFPPRLEWTATPASLMEVTKLPEEEKQYTPPVNYRLEQLVNERAGRHPKARWIKRRADLTEDFPPLLVREDWESEQDQMLCQRYIERQAPRLLMLHGLEHDQRLRLEGYARQNALEVDRFFHLYPDVVDEKMMSAIRVEARLRLSAGDTGRR